MRPAEKKMQAATAKSVEEIEAWRKAEERFIWPSEEEKDDFYCWVNHSICELNNCLKTSEAQLKYVIDTMSTMFEHTRAEKDVAFLESSTKRSLKVSGNK